jgi:hypothetical protein
MSSISVVCLEFLRTPERSAHELSRVAGTIELSAGCLFDRVPALAKETFLVKILAPPWEVSSTRN